MSATHISLAEIRGWTKAGLSLKEAGEVLGVDPRTVSEGIKSGNIPAIKVGRRVIIPRERFLALFDTEMAASA